MPHRQTRPHHELRNEIAVAHAPHAVLRDGLEAELAREERAVDDERVSGQRAGAEREDGDAGDELAEAEQIVVEGERV